jgi:hypothetical protein
MSSSGMASHETLVATATEKRWPWGRPNWRRIMMKSRTRLPFPAAFLLSTLLLAASPSPQTAAEAPCGPNNGNLCWSDESCLNILFYKQCTTKYRYYPKPAKEAVE